MKSPSYILKNIYQERNLQRDWEYHLKKLNEISQRPPMATVKEKDVEVQSVMKVRNKSKQNALKFSQIERALERSRENQSLLEKMLMIQQPKRTQTQQKRLFYNFQDKISQESKLSKFYSTKSLIGNYKKEEENRIIIENFNMAKRMINLPSVINLHKMDKDFQQHQNGKDDLNLIKKYRSLKPIQMLNKTQNYYQTIQGYLNATTKSKFQKTKSYSNFQYIYPKIQGQTTLFFIEIKNVNLTSPHSNNQKNIPNYFWEGLIDQKMVFSSNPESFEFFQNQLIDVATSKQLTMTLKVLKVKNHDEVEVGQVQIEENEVEFISSKDFGRRKILQQKHLSIFSRESNIKKMTIQKVIEKQSAPVGNLEIKIYLLCDLNFNFERNLDSQIKEDEKYQVENVDQIEINQAQDQQLINPLQDEFQDQDEQKAQNQRKSLEQMVSEENKEQIEENSQKEENGNISEEKEDQKQK